jgi:hypothetical protein
LKHTEPVLTRYRLGNIKSGLSNIVLFLLLITYKDNDVPSLNYDAGKRKCGSRGVYPRYQTEESGQNYDPAGVSSGIGACGIRARLDTVTKREFPLLRISSRGHPTQEPVNILSYIGFGYNRINNEIYAQLCSEQIR